MSSQTKTKSKFLQAHSPTLSPQQTARSASGTNTNEGSLRPRQLFHSPHAARTLMAIKRDPAARNLNLRLAVSQRSDAARSASAPSGSQPAPTAKFAELRAKSRGDSLPLPCSPACPLCKFGIANVLKTKMTWQLRIDIAMASLQVLSNSQHFTFALEQIVSFLSDKRHWWTLQKPDRPPTQIINLRSQISVTLHKYDNTFYRAGRDQFGRLGSTTHSPFAAPLAYHSERNWWRDRRPKSVRRSESASASRSSVSNTPSRFGGKVFAHQKITNRASAADLVAPARARKQTESAEFAQFAESGRTRAQETWSSRSSGGDSSKENANKNKRKQPQQDVSLCAAALQQQPSQSQVQSSDRRQNRKRKQRVARARKLAPGFGLDFVFF